MEREQAATDFKFGVLYAKKGQTHEDEMFSNSKPQPPLLSLSLSLSLLTTFFFLSFFLSFFLFSSQFR